MKAKDECLYYIIRKMGGLGVRAKDVYFDNALRHIERDGLNGMCRLEVEALIMAARERGRLNELDYAVEAAIKEEHACTAGKDK